MFLSGLPQLPSEEADSLERDFSLEEILSSLQHMVNNKSPGPDGLPKEFYLLFVDIIGPVLAQVYKLIFQEKHLSRSQSLSYITLLCKDSEHSDLMKNYRPISLLNVDYKILSKSLANRLSSVLHIVVRENQTCSV